MRLEELKQVDENLNSPLPYVVSVDKNIIRGEFTTNGITFNVMSYNGTIPKNKYGNDKELKFSSILLMKTDGDGNNMNASKGMSYATAASVLSTVVDFCVKHIVNNTDLIFIKPYDDDEIQLDKKKALYKGIAFKLIHKWGSMMYAIPPNEPVAFLVSKLNLTQDEVINMAAFAQEDKF